MGGLKKKVDGEFVEVVTPGDPGTVLTAGEDRKAEWAKPKNKFRGEWSPDQLSWVSDFSGGLKAPFSGRVEGAGVLPKVDPKVPAGQPYTTSILTSTNVGSLANKSFLTLDLEALNLKNLTRAKFWVGFIDAFSSFETYGTARGMADGVQIWSKQAPNGAAWSQDSFSIPAGASKIEFGFAPNSTTNEVLGAHYAGIELYTIDQPYMLGDFVTYQGDMWRSKVNNNAQTPSKTATAWEKAVTLPPASGTTAQRPSAASVGKGYQYYDETLSKPIWSDGAAWKDASAAAV